MRPDGAALQALLRRPALRRLLSALDGGGEEVRVVGGAVRNALLGRPVHEVDLATTARPDSTARRARAAGLRAVPTGIAHGTVTVIVDDERFEVTTLRRDVETDGRHATVRFGRDFAEDAERRDFTLNALSLDASGALHDPVGGLPDLEAGRVRFIGEADRRISEDYLRVLRFFRFTAEYAAGAIDADGLGACIRGRDGLARLSSERVRAELLKLAAAPRAPEVMGAMEEAGILGRLVSTLIDAGRLRRAAASGAGPLARLAAGLVRTREDGERLRDELRLSNAETAEFSAYAGALAQLLSQVKAAGPGAVRRAVARCGVAAVGLAAAATDGEPRPALSGDARAALGRFLSGEDPPPRFPLGGRDLLAAGVPPGPELGRRLAEERDAWLAAGCPDIWPGTARGR